MVDVLYRMTIGVLRGETAGVSKGLSCPDHPRLLWAHPLMSGRDPCTNATIPVHNDKHVGATLHPDGMAPRKTAHPENEKPMSLSLEPIARDIRYALRTLRREPAFAAGVVLTFALAIGANAAMF